MSNTGLICPYEDCRNTKGIKYIKTINMVGKIIRGHKCPKCGRSFESEQVAVARPFYKKENPDFNRA